MTASRFDIKSLLNNVSLSESSEYRKIYYQDIVPDEDNPYSLDHIIELANTIENCGLLEPLVVKKTYYQQYMIVSGHRRYEAISFLVEKRNKRQFENIPCIVLPENTEELLTRIMLHISNTTQRTLTVSETLSAIAELKELYKDCEARGIHLKGKIRDQIASDIHLAPRQVQKYMTINEKADEDTLSLLENGEITVSDAYEKTKRSAKNTPFTPAKKLTSITKQLQKINDSLNSDDVNNAISLLKKELSKYEAEKFVSNDHYN